MMVREAKRRWRLQYSLRTFMLASVVVGGGVGWIAHHYRQYSAEQRVITTVMKRLPASDLWPASADGETRYIAGSPVT